METSFDNFYCSTCGTEILKSESYRTPIGRVDRYRIDPITDRHLRERDIFPFVTRGKLTSWRAGIVYRDGQNRQNYGFPCISRNIQGGHLVGDNLLLTFQ